jgi:anti-sigma factor RsiW
MGSEDLCRMYAPILAALDEYAESGMEAETVTKAQAHLAGCARCQARYHGWREQDGALRASLAATPIPTELTAANLLAAIGANHEPRERRPVMLSLVTLRNEYDVDDETQTPLMQSGANNNPSAQPGFAPVPAIRSLRQPQTPWRRALSGLLAVAAVAALIAGVTSALNLTGRLGAAHPTESAHASATTTNQSDQSGQANFPSASDYGISSLSMDSATDGWAAVYSKDPSQCIILHITNSSVIKQATLVIPNVSCDYATIQALAPTDVWLVSSNLFGEPSGVLYHYDGAGWRLVSLPAPANVAVQHFQPIALQMHSPTDGVVIGEYDTVNSQGVAGYIYYHYDGSVWRIERTVNSSNGTVYTISATPDGDTWAAGAVQPTDASNSAGATTVYHRVNDAWQVSRQLTNFYVADVTMASPSVGWMVGSSDGTTLNSSGGTDGYEYPAVFAWDGVRWSEITLPGIPQDRSQDTDVTLSEIAAASPTNAWVLGTVSNTLPPAIVPYASETSFLDHFDGRTWTQVALPNIVAYSPPNSITSTNAVAFDKVVTAPNGDLWIMGVWGIGSWTSAYISPSAPLLYRFSGGQWHRIMLPKLS